MSNFKNLMYLGVRVDYEVRKENFKNYFKELIKNDFTKIYTVNPEFIVDSFFDSQFKKELNSSNLNVIDGVGLVYGIKQKFKNVLNKEDLKNIKTFTGVDLVLELLEIAEKENLSIFILGGSKKDNVSEKTLNKISKNYPGIRIIGGSSNFSYKEEDDSATLNYIHSCMKSQGVPEIDILLVGYGHKKQEFWISRNYKKIPSRVCIGVGGTLDYLSGNVKRAPLWIRNLGMEWLYRLILQPKRILRIIKATLIFSYLSSRVN